MSRKLGAPHTSQKEYQFVPVELNAYDPVRDLATLSFSSGKFGKFLRLGSADEVGVSSPIVTYGFPHAPTGRLVLTAHSAEIGAKILIGSQSQKVKHIVLNTQAQPGQSGGPVLDRKSGKVVGVILGSYRPEGGGVTFGSLDPATLHQTTHAVSSEYLKDMV